MRLQESILFLFLALAAHVGAVALTRNDGEQSSGAGGDASVTLVATTASIAAMVEEWERPPDTEMVADQPEPTGETTPPLDLPKTQTMPTFERPVAVQTASAQMQLPLTIPDALPLPAPVSAQQTPKLSAPGDARPAPPVDRPQVTSRPTRIASARLNAPTSTDVRPEVDTSSASNALRAASRPKTRPKKPVEAREKAKQSSTASTAQPKATARGTGAGLKLGQSGMSTSSTANQGNKASLIAKWSAQIQRATQRKLVYPRKARARQMTGRVLVRIQITTNGKLVSSSISKSSGNPILDQSALKTVARVGKFPAAPKGVAQDTHNFRIPVSFRLK